MEGSTLLIALFFAAGMLELLVRMAIFVFATPSQKAKIKDLGLYGDPAETRIQGHAFLQFTGRIGKPSGFQRLRAYGDYGFVNISAADLPKPAGVIRIACLGGSTTEYGYPAFLEEILQKEGRGKKFQVLNFGMSWWTSLHTLVNYVLNVRDFRPDILVIHQNVNDHKYRGYGAIRGDGAHAFVPWSYRGAPDRYLIHFSVIYRILRLKMGWIYRLLPKFGDFPEEPDRFSQILQQRGKTLHYVPQELALYRRNIETILCLAKAEGTKVVLTTEPFSTLEDDELHDAIRGHMREVNALIRQIAQEQGVILADLAETANDPDFFLDMVHVNQAGDQKKALEISKSVFQIT